MARGRRATLKTTTVVLNTPKTRQRSQNVVVVQAQKTKNRRKRNRNTNLQMSRTIRGIGKQAENLNAAAAKLLLDPCKARLTYGPMSGSTDNGYLLRVTKRVAIHGTAASTGGSLVWFPDFHCGGGLGMNGFLYETGLPNTAPTNTIANPYGSAGSGVVIVSDPAQPWVNGSNCAEARTIAACIRFMPTGAVTSTQGQFSAITGITPQQLMTSGATGPMSVSELQNFSQDITRVSLTPNEVRHAPSTNSSVYRGVDSSADPSTICVQLGVTGTSASTFGVLSSQTNGIGVTWLGLNSGASNDVIIELIKIIEWLPDANVGVSQPQAPMRPTATWEDIQSSFNAQVPAWQTAAWDSINDGIRGGVNQATQGLINSVFTGIPLSASMYAANRITHRMMVPAM